jgi:hypothetical protein
MWVERDMSSMFESLKEAVEELHVVVQERSSWFFVGIIGLITFNIGLIFFLAGCYCVSKCQNAATFILNSQWSLLRVILKPLMIGLLAYSVGLVLHDRVGSHFG